MLVEYVDTLRLGSSTAVSPELNPGGSKLLFRDKRRQLHLYNIKEQKKQTLLNYCKFVGWVPRSDVVVAQNRNNLCVWYSIEEADKVTMYQIKGPSICG